MTRKELNLEILKHLNEAVKCFPELRFHQLLAVCGINKNSDAFYEESSETLDRLLNTLDLLYADILEQNAKGKKE